MDTGKTKDWQAEKALERFQMIAPLQDEELDRDKKIALRKEIADEHGLSEKTIRRYERAYEEEGFNGLCPRERGHGPSRLLPDDFPELLSEAIQLRREVPTRSVEQLILILEGEGRVAPGVLKRSTLQRYLYNAGFGVEQMKKYNEGRASSSQRFCKPHRMMLVQADIKYGPLLPIGPDGKKVQTYLSSLIDDHSRFILFSQFYDNQSEEIVHDSFHQAVLLHGKFDQAYCDNGSQYISGQLIGSAARLGIRILHARPYSGKSKGKIEKFHQVVDDFIAEAKAKKIRTLEDLNRYWTYYLEEYYQKRPHDGIREYYKSLGVEIPARGISPEEEWKRDSRGLIFLDAGVVGEAFLRHETRKVDKGGCISFRNEIYEVSVALIGATVEIAYDPANTDVLTVSCKGMEPFQVGKCRIDSYCSPKPELPERMQPAEPETSRFLDILEKKHAESTRRRADAISYGACVEEGADHV